MTRGGVQEYTEAVREQYPDLTVFHKLGIDNGARTTTDFSLKSMEP